MICQLCARHLAVPAVRSHVDPDGYVWWFCERHARPLVAWERRRAQRVNEQQKEAMR